MKMRLASVSLIALLGMTAAIDSAMAGWSSIATDDRGSWGWTHNYRGKGEAIVDAMNACGNLSCVWKFVTTRKCIAYAESRAGGYWYGISRGNASARVRAGALEACARGAPAGTCHIQLHAC